MGRWKKRSGRLALTASAICCAAAAWAAETVTHTYDALGRLVTTNVSIGPGAGTSTAVQYDPAGNRSNYIVTGASTSVPLTGLVVLPIAGFTVVPIAAVGSGSSTPPAPSSILFSLAGGVAANEGDVAVVTVTKSAPLIESLTVNYATVDGTAVAPGDYVATNGTLTFLGWETSKSISIPINVDSVSEGSEAFTLNLSSPSSGSSLGLASSTVTINANAVNGAPTPQADYLSVGVCSYETINVVANDTDPESNYPLSLVSLSGGSPKGIASIVNSTTIGFSAAGAAGGATVSYVVKDSLGAQATGFLYITVTAGSGCN